MNTIQKLEELFAEFPGIGQRQAKRFVYYLLTRNNGFIENLSSEILKLKKEIQICSSCYRFFQKDKSDSKECQICRNPNREKTSIMIVSRDIDMENIEKTHLFNGLYFILGGTVPILEKEPEKRIRQGELLNIIEKRIKSGLLKEIILGLNATSEGENTADYVKSILIPITKNKEIKITTLGRGLSTGTELEYSDSNTLLNALKNRQ